MKPVEQPRPEPAAAARAQRPTPLFGFIRAPRDAAAGLFLIAIAVVALWQGADLTTGTPRQFGPGMVPQALSVVLALTGAALILFACLRDGAALDRWSLRGPFFILGAAVVFGLTIRPLGLLVAAPLTIAIGVLASRELRWVEIAVFAAAMTLFCWLLFRVALSLPIPLAPWWLGY